jgi:acyl-CoA synthetase (AMP-forming)/AMP-acid ligase II
MSIAVLQADRPEVLAEQLTSAWRSGDSFACVPAKAGLTDEHIQAALQAIPGHLHKGHFVMLTSGSTGEPKFIVGNQLRATALAAELHRVQCSEEVQCTVVTLPLSYSYAFVNQFVWSQTLQRKLVLTEGLGNPAGLAAALEGGRDIMLCLVGAQVPLLLRHWNERRFTHVVRLHFAGGRFPQDSLDALQRMFPSAHIFNNYGCAEAMPRLTIRRAHAANEAADIGEPLSGVQLRTALNGALEFRSPYQAVGVVQQGIFREISDEDWTPTGDLGEPSRPGAWRLLGRSSEVFKRFGEKVSLPRLLDAVKAVWPAEAVFFFLPPTPGADPAHVLALAPPPQPDALRQVLMCLRAGFSRAQWPVQVVAVDTIPVLANGKPDTAALSSRGDAQILWRQRN